MSAIAQALSRIAPWLLQEIAWPMLWQSSLLIGLLFLLDFVLKRRLRPAVRYALWLVLLFKLVLPPSLASPSAPAWWVRRPALKYPAPSSASMRVQYGPSASQTTPVEPASKTLPRIQAVLSAEARVLLFFGVMSSGLFAWMLVRWRQVALMVRAAPPAPLELQELLREDTRLLGFKRPITLKLCSESTSPAVFGLIRPVILLPNSIMSRLNEGQLRAVLMHELIHLRRGDVWINCIQTLLQIAYWWHPLLWLANARIRRVREEAVDDSVMCALRGEADSYPQALIEVAKLTVRRSISSLALVGILESRHALYYRIERLLNGSRTKRARLSLGSLLCILAFSAIALPMGEAPRRPAELPQTQQATPDRWPDSRFPGYAEVPLSVQFLIVESSSLELFVPALTGSKQPLVVSSNEVSDLNRKLERADAQTFPPGQTLGVAHVSGGRFHYRVGGVGNNSVNYQTIKRPNGSTVVVGAECAFCVATRPDWVDVDLTIVPWTDGSGTLCQLNLGLANSPATSQDAEITIPSGGAMIWRVTGDLSPGKTELVLLKQLKSPAARRSPDIDFLPESTVQNSQLEKLIAGARRAFESGKLDAADELLQEALQIDGRSPAAYYYLNLIREMRAKQIPPVRLWYPGGTNLVYASTTPQTYLAGLGLIRLKRISFDHLPLMTVVRVLNEQAWPDFTFNLKSVAADSPPSTAENDTKADDISQVSITILPDLTDIRLVDLLDTIVRVSPRPITYAVQGNAVEFAPATSDSKLLYTRVMRINTRILPDRLHDLTGAKDLSVSDAPGKALLEFLVDRGISLQPPETLFFSDISGGLMVRATLADLAKIEEIIHELNTPPPQLNFKVRFLTVPEKELAQIWQRLGPVKVGATNTCKILTPPQTADLLRALLKIPGGHLINEASVTTRSGRETLLQSVDVQTVISNGVPTQITTGPQIHLIGSLSSDLWRVDLTADASLTEFLGYEKSKLPPPRATPGLLMALPQIKVRQITARNTVPDGYTVVIANLPGAKTNTTRSARSRESQYIVMVTSTLIDGVGNRMRNDADIESLMR
jgi:beta-lactamase regulating signal transducer with metallopeptidase domain